MKRPTESDFEGSGRSGAIEVRFKPTISSFTYYRLAYSHDVATVGAVKHGPNRTTRDGLPLGRLLRALA
jgi:hypothetical protein